MVGPLDVETPWSHPVKAAVLTELKPLEEGPLVLEEVDTPEPGLGQVLIRVAACGVCRSNLHMIEGDWAPDTPTFLPIVPGHEVVGTIETVGQGVDGLAVGDRVGVQPLWSTCGRCRYCLSARDELCQAKEITGESVDGGYAEYVLATAAHTHVLPDELGFAEAAPLFCPGITAYNALSRAGITPVSRVAVFGIGGVGHMVVQLAVLAGATVYAVARGQNHLDLARELGATPVSATDADPVQVLDGEGGMDVSLVFAPSSAVLAQAVAATRPGGTIVLGVHADLGEVPFPDEKTIVGSVLGNRQQMREVLDLAAAGRIRAQVQTFTLDQAGEALAALKAGEVRARAVIVL